MSDDFKFEQSYCTDCLELLDDSNSGNLCIECYKKQPKDFNKHKSKYKSISSRMNGKEGRLRGYPLSSLAQSYKLSSIPRGYYVK
jgi:hypothetical protein